jgi:hypothetical protein
MQIGKRALVNVVHEIPNGDLSNLLSLPATCLTTSRWRPERLPSDFKLVSLSAYSSTQKMEDIYSSETMVWLSTDYTALYPRRHYAFDLNILPFQTGSRSTLVPIHGYKYYNVHIQIRSQIQTRYVQYRSVSKATDWTAEESRSDSSQTQQTSLFSTESRLALGTT